MRVHDLGLTVQYDDPTWNGDGFSEQRPYELWRRLPESLKAIAVEEIRQGNIPKSILENKERNIVLLSFRGGPAIQRQENQTLRVHTAHQNGNYCYDGTNATYEDIQTGCFLAFDDPNYGEPAV
jgi:hypothetical protein